MRRFLAAGVALLAAAGLARAQSMGGPSSSSSFNFAPYSLAARRNPSSQPLPAAKGPTSFRPAPGSGKKSLTLRVQAPSLDEVMGMTRVDVFGGTVVSNAPVATTTANIQRLRQLQLQRAQQARQVERPLPPSGPRHSASHTLTIGFDLPAAAREEVRTDFLRRMDELGDRLAVADFRVTMDGRQAVVTGTAPDEETRELVTRYLQLEPGVDAVDNQLSLPPEGI